MYIIINEAFLEPVKHLNYTIDATDNSQYLLGKISKINFFVGSNNSGKSTFLRNLLIQSNYQIAGHPLTLTHLKRIEDIIRHQYDSIENNASISLSDISTNTNIVLMTEKEAPALNEFLTNYPNEIFVLNKLYFREMIKLFNHSDESQLLKLNSELKKLHTMINVAMELSNAKYRTTYLQGFKSKLFHLQENFPWSVKPILDALSPELSNYLSGTKLFITPTQKRYIPILRTLTTLFDKTRNETEGLKITKNIFEGTIIKNYFQNKLSDNILIYTGLDFYDNILSIRNNEKKIRNDFEFFEKFLSETFFPNQEVEIIAKPIRVSQDMHISLFLNGVENDIHHFGDGIQCLILLLYPIFTAPNESWIFIEEPELNLHPGYQRIFLNTILNNKLLDSKKLRFFITTHSNHLLDLTLSTEANISIFNFKEQITSSKKFKRISNVKNNDIDSLEILGVNNSSVYLANCGIWVEGHTDTLYLRAFLKAYEIHLNQEIKLKEDLHYAFYEYGGSNVSHYLFGDLDQNEKVNLNKIKARFLSNKILLIADKDSKKEAKHKRLNSWVGNNFSYYTLPVREIENLLSPYELKIILPKLHSKLNRINWSKISLLEKNYANEYLGTYLLQTIPTQFPPTIKTSSGSFTTFYKNKIASFLEDTLTWETMSNNAKILTKHVYTYIMSNNGPFE